MNISDMTPRELAEKTIKDISKKRELKRQAERAALDHCMDNRQKINKKLKRCSYSSKNY
ncbi:hypothetical protein [Clostridium sp. C2-6-12]|uniref:hypothetical protein n=1 Tax=Clostridium sp. C2-6-12 TaxID=2698832 RepID=UPI00136A0108|nr:hypothetical protein [Clostridium sp. C2-6-12]